MANNYLLVAKAEKVKIGALSEVDDRSQRVVNDLKNVAAVDFGTTFCSVAFKLKNTPGKFVENIELEPGHERTPTAILLQWCGEQLYSVADFGACAQEKVTTLLQTELKNDYLYFELFKMELRSHDINRKMIVTSMNEDKKFYLVQVIAFVLKHLKAKFNLWMQRVRTGLTASDMHWVITVPAIWKPAGKQMMREAAYLACLCSDKDGISSLIPYGQQIMRPVTKNEHKLSLALEPECAALYCLQLDNDKMQAYSDPIPDSEEMKNYLVLDIGGGTTDITAQVYTEPDSYEVIIPPTGNDHGGARVNQNFSLFLEKIVQDPGFSKFLTKKGREEQHHASLRSIIYLDFEKLKLRFGELQSTRATGHSRLILNHKFVKFYKMSVIQEGIENLNDPRVVLLDNDDDAILQFSNSKMEEFFLPVLKEIDVCVINALQRVAVHNISTVFIAGGFGGCWYVFSHLKNVIVKQTVGEKKLSLLVPSKHTLAVSKGAVIYGLNPGVIKARAVDASYGIKINLPFKEGVHKESQRWCDSADEHEVYCKDVFKAFVLQNDMVKADDVFNSGTLIPVSQSSTYINFEFYRSTNPRVQYTTDDDTKQIGIIELKILNSENFPRKERKMEVIMSFSSTEIKASARAIYLPGKPPVKIILDLLS